MFANRNIDLVFCDRGLTDGTYLDILTIRRLLSRNLCLVVTSRPGNLHEYLETLHHGAFDLIASPSQTSDLVCVIDQARARTKRHKYTCFRWSPHRIRVRPV